MGLSQAKKRGARGTLENEVGEKNEPVTRQASDKNQLKRVYSFFSVHFWAQRNKKYNPLVTVHSSKPKGSESSLS